MIVTESTLAGYTVINGTWQLQFALFIAQIFNNYYYPF
jgi:hypothetical protein